MLKSLRFSAALIAVVATQISTAFLTSPATAANIATLNAQLKQSICTQNWGEAVKVIDQMIAITPSSNQTQHNELKMHRLRMQNLSVSKTNVDSWLESYCATPVTTPVATNITIDNTDRAFIEHYKSLIISLHPDKKSALLSDLQRRPTSIVVSAKAYCKGLRSGFSPDKILDIQAEILVEFSPKVRENLEVATGTVNHLAPKYYCPEFADH